MVIDENIEAFNDSLKELSGNYNFLYSILKQLKDNDVDYSIVQKSEKYIKNESSRMERIKKAYDGFSSQINQLCEKYMNEVNSIEKEHNNEVEDLKNDFEVIMNELKLKNEGFKTVTLEQEKEFSFVYQKALKSKMDVELVKKYPGSYVYREYMYGTRNKDGDVFIDCDGTNDELIVKYMKNDKSLVNDIRKMSNEKKVKLLSDMTFLELPIKKEILRELGRNEDNEIMEAWRDRRVVMVNTDNATTFNTLLMKYNLFNSLFDNECLKNIQYYKENNTFFINLNMKYLDVIEDYLKNGKMINREMIETYSDYGNADELMNEMKMIGIELSNDNIKVIRGCFRSKFLKESTIIEDTQYDDVLKEWLGSDHKWKLIYRASKHGYTAESFHNRCNNTKPTLIIIKSDNNCIFGGYTTQTWSGSIYYINISIIIGEWKDDDKGFIFTLKNLHGVEPSKFMKKKDNNRAICCNPSNGPIFGYGTDIGICGNCNIKNGGWTNFGNSAGSYECNNSQKRAFFVNTAKPDETNYFKVSDYEVFTYY